MSWPCKEAATPGVCLTDIPKFQVIYKLPFKSLLPTDTECSSSVDWLPLPLHVLVLRGHVEVLEHVGQELEGGPLVWIGVPALQHDLVDVGLKAGKGTDIEEP